MDASEEMIALLREIRDLQQRQIELHEAWRAESERERVERRDEWSQQIEMYRALSEKYDEGHRAYLDAARSYQASNQTYVETAKTYDEANRAYLRSMNNWSNSRPLVLAVSAFVVLMLTRSAAFSWFRPTPP